MGCCPSRLFILLSTQYKEVVTHMMEDARRIIDDSIRAVLPDAAVYRAPLIAVVLPTTS